MERYFSRKKEKTKRYIIASCIIIEYNIVRQFVNLFFKAYDPISPTRLVKIYKKEKHLLNLVFPNSNMIIYIINFIKTTQCIINRI